MKHTFKTFHHEVQRFDYQIQNNEKVLYLMFPMLGMFRPKHEGLLCYIIRT